MRGKKLTGRGVSAMLGATTMAFLIVIVAFVGGCGGEEDTSSSTDESAEQEVAEQNSEPEGTEAAGESGASIGEPVAVGDVRWAVTDAEQSDIVVSRLGTAEGNFVIVNVTFQNNSNQDITLATPLLPLVDSEGREFEADIESNFLHVYPEENMFVDHIEPGATKEGQVIYSVDPNASGFKLQVGEANFASDETEYIDLGF